MVDLSVLTDNDLYSLMWSESHRQIQESYIIRIAHELYNRHPDDERCRQNYLNIKGNIERGDGKWRNEFDYPKDFDSMEGCTNVNPVVIAVNTLMDAIYESEYMY